MKKTIIALALTGALAAPAWASGYHRGPHDGPVLHADAMAIGYPGDPAMIDRTVEVTMLDASDTAMAYDPGVLDIRRGETVRIVLINKGSVAHEFVMATPEEIEGHRREMHPLEDMPHEAAFAARVEPGRSRDLVWTFANEGTFEFACLMPGHSEAGMHGRLTVG